MYHLSTLEQLSTNSCHCSKPLLNDEDEHEDVRLNLVYSFDRTYSCKLSYLNAKLIQRLIMKMHINIK